MADVALPNDARGGPTKPEVRAVLLDKLALAPDDHFVEVGCCTGAVTIEATRRAGRVTTLDRKANRTETTRANLAANDTQADIEHRSAQAPEAPRQRIVRKPIRTACRRPTTWSAAARR